ncbi:TetR/AcrR family transcriptional regulator [Maricaulis sp. D1M11]|uniref:TetR/AcrR family transcriptional regulator n=1 Tax=Maricaulis sp. D1M11 TaxID=3076117 RepID=UPI0039B37241
MTKKQEQKERTRVRIRAAAGQAFKTHGFGGVGVDAIAKTAEATSGAFYAHFGSKAGAFDAAVEDGLQDVLDRLPIFQRDNGLEWVKAFADYYLGREHREDIACGCAMTGLSPDVVRAQDKTRDHYGTQMNRIAERIAEGLDEQQGGDDRVARGWALLSTLIGGLTMARAVPDEATASRIARAAHAAALAAAGPTRDVTL